MESQIYTNITDSIEVAKCHLLNICLFFMFALIKSFLFGAHSFRQAITFKHVFILIYSKSFFVIHSELSRKKNWFCK